MCTVVVRWAAGRPVLVLALRDEHVGRDFEDPDAWWPEQPAVIGGCDKSAGGSWAVTDVPSGVTALVLNRPERREAEAGAPSRGVLPLLAVERGELWTEELALDGMASFSLVRAAPDALTLWTFDGAELSRGPLGPGTHLITSGGAEDGKADRFLAAFDATTTTEGWMDLVRGRVPTDDPAALVVRHESEDRVFATVFGQLIEATPGALSLWYSRTPWEADPWTRRRWPNR